MSQDLIRLKAISSDPWEFLKGVRTLDQVDRKNPVKNFPVHLSYIKLYVRVWEKEPLIAIPKSRRMKMSWTNVALYTWDTMFHAGRSQAFVSKKEEDSDELVQRSKFIVEHLDPAVIPLDLMPKHEYTYAKLKFPEMESQIQGFPSGANQLRQAFFLMSGPFGITPRTLTALPTLRLREGEDLPAFHLEALGFLSAFVTTK